MDDCEPKAVGASFVTLLALSLTLFSNFWCDYVYQEVTIVTSHPQTDLSTLSNEKRYYGIWAWRDYTIKWVRGSGDDDNLETTERLTLLPDPYCRNYMGVKMPVDGLWYAAAAFTAVASAVGGCLVVSSCLATCVGPGARVWRVLSVSALANAVFQSLTLLFLNSTACQQLEGSTGRGDDSYFASSGCHIAAGAKLGIASIVLWFVASAMTFAAGHVASKNKIG